MIIWIIALIASIKQYRRLYDEPSIMMVGFAELLLLEIPLMLLIAGKIG